MNLGYGSCKLFANFSRLFLNNSGFLCSIERRVCWVHLKAIALLLATFGLGC